MAIVAAFPLAAETAGGEPPKEAIEALRAAQELVADWRGVGQPKRGSSAGAWIEEAQWGWDFDPDSASLRLKSTGAKYLAEARLAPPPAGESEYVLSVTGPQGDSTEYRGGPTRDGRWEFTASQTPPGRPARVSWKFVADGARLVMLLEGRGGSESFHRIAEIGMTRRGARFAAGDSHPECVVTGGRGTLTVEFEGQTYFVCCGGCKDLFESDPRRVLAEYRERKKRGDEAD